MNYANHHVIITGGSSGIGKAVACTLAGMGAHITIIARNREILRQAEVEINAARKETNQKVVALSADVSQRDRIELAISDAVGRSGPCDVLVTSAGMAHPGYFMELPIDIFEETMAVNYFGSLYAIRAVVPEMVRRKKGHLVLISSGAALVGIFGYTPYSPSKFALRGLAESLRGELKPEGVTVSIVYPPDTDTPQLEQENRTKPAETKLMTATAKMWTPEDVARVIVQGMRKKSFAINPGMEMGMLSRFHSLLNPMTHRYFDHLAVKARRQKEKNADSRQKTGE